MATMADILESAGLPQEDSTVRYVDHYCPTGCIINGLDIHNYEEMGGNRLEYGAIYPIPYALRNDYVTSSPWTRANFEFLSSNYGEELYKELYSHPLHRGLWVPLYRELSEGLETALKTLVCHDGYYVLDEDRTLEIEGEILKEAWSEDGYCTSDLLNDLPEDLAFGYDDLKELGNLVQVISCREDIYPIYETSESLSYGRRDWDRLVTAVVKAIREE